MKIFLIMLGSRFGGVERLYVDLAAALSQRGHDVLALSRAGSDVASRLKSLPPCPHLQHETLVHVLGPRDPFAPGKIARLIRTCGSEILHAFRGRDAYIASKVAGRLGVPLIAHAMRSPRTNFQRVALFQPATEAERDCLIEQGVPRDRIRVVGLFSFVAPVPEVVCADRVTRIVAHGRFVAQKGFDLLLGAFHQLPDERLQLHLAGAGPEHRRLREQVASLGLQGRVHFAGWQQDIRRFLLAGDLFVLPSRGETFGLSLLEAMACGIPVVATRCDGPLEVVDDSSAWLCGGNDQQALAAAMRSAIADPEGRRRRARAALARFRDRYAGAQVLPRFEALYEYALRQR